MATADPKEENPGEQAKRDFHLSGESQKLINELLEVLKPSEGHNPDQKRVIVQYYINRIFSVDVVNECVHLDLYLKVNWLDPNYKGVSDDDFQADETRFQGEKWWEPGVEVVNSIDLEKLIEHDEAFWVEDSTHGILAYTQRFVGNISTPFDLHQFPFDTQLLQITFESFHWKEDDMIMFCLARQADQLPPKPGGSWPALSNNVKLNEYDIRRIKTIEQHNYYDFEDRTYSQINVVVTLERKYMFYLAKIVSVLSIIVIMNWVVFFFPQEDLSDRINISVTLLLAEVAFQFVTSASLPRISYNTKLDTYLLLCYVYNVLTMIETVIVNFVARNEGLTSNSGPPVQSTAQLIDWCMLGVFPGTFLIMNIVFYVTGVSRIFNKHPKLRPPRSKHHEESETLLASGMHHSKVEHIEL